MKTLIASMAGLGLCAASQAAIVQWAGNGHYYERVDASVTWDAAKTAAAAKTYNSFRGYLVTITSAEENLFLTDNAELGAGGANLLHYHWTGGYQPAGSGEPAGGWSWVTGEAFSYSNWEPGEPNNSGGNESAIVFDHGIHTDGKAWNDLNPAAPTRGYIVEYDATPVPEPATYLAGLSALGMLGLFGWRNRK